MEWHLTAEDNFLNYLGKHSAWRRAPLGAKCFGS